MDSAIVSAAIAGAVALLLSFLTNRQKAKSQAAADKRAAEVIAGAKAAEVIAAETARRKVLAELDDIAMDRAARINDTIIGGLNLRIDILQDELDWSEGVIFTFRRSLQDAGLALPAVPPRPVRRFNPPEL